MSDDPFTITLDDEEPRRGRPGFFLTLLAAVALATAVFAAFRNHALDNRVTALATQADQLGKTQEALSRQIRSLAESEAQADSETRKQIENLLGLSRDVAALEATTSELQDRAALPQRSWARAEALALLELAARQLKVERNVGAAIEAMATADARLAQLREPALNTVRQQLKLELQALHSFPQADIAGITGQLRLLESTVGNLTPRGIFVGDEPAQAGAGNPDGAVRRAWRVAKTTLGNLITVRRTTSNRESLVTLEEQSIRRQRLQLLLLEARVAVTRADPLAFTAAITAARSWLKDNFDAADANAAEVARGLDSLAPVNVAPPLPDISGSLRLLNQLVPLTRPVP